MELSKYMENNELSFRKIKMCPFQEQKDLLEYLQTIELSKDSIMTKSYLFFHIGYIMTNLKKYGSVEISSTGEKITL